ncbi:hypothetical protein OG765_31025 [Streptomyces sp. NBC_00555]|uniref:hypothetical protein n=1 Tax=Streptomyces sp. NBC_00555 TaxID=2903662 RepID=UPI0022540C11|nr:hypothetical protein [Streptomyces sp. NBC_00555]MCX5015353.1 hypothetical protein [Streptomyces sp. NBC_00555]
MDGLWKAMRQEGFTRLAARLDAVSMCADPVRDLAALGAAYLANALVATGPLPDHALDHGLPMLTALFVSAGDTPDSCRRSVELGWQSHNSSPLP